jgi:hypothetical protein
MKALIISIILILAAYLIWPFTVLFQLERAMLQDDRGAIAEIIDVNSLRDQIKRRMNKEVESSIGEVSNSFVDWLQSGLQRLGADAVDKLVTLDWALAQLRTHNRNPHRGGYMDHLTYAFFDGPDRLLLRIGDLDEHPVHAHLTLRRAEWRITSIYN